MYFSELLAALRRRWWLVIVGVLGTAALVFGAYVLVPADEEIHATVVVLPPMTTTQQVGNPFLALGGLEPAADVLVRAMNGGAVQEDLAPRTGTAEYGVARDTSAAGPVLLVTATDRTPQQASALLDAVLARMPQVFSDLQKSAGVSAGAAMTVSEVARETQPLSSTKSQMRAVLLAAVGGLAVTLFGTNLIDGLVLRRGALRPKRAVRGESVADADRTPHRVPEPTPPPVADLPWLPVSHETNGSAHRFALTGNRRDPREPSKGMRGDT